MSKVLGSIKNLDEAKTLLDSAIDIIDLKDLVIGLLPNKRGDLVIFTISGKDLCQALLPLMTLSGEIICI